MNSTTRHIGPISLALPMLLLAFSAGADEVDYGAAEAQLRTIVPNTASIAISDSPVDGLLQAQVDNEIVYVSVDGRFLVQGTMFDIEHRVNLTDQAKSGMRKELLLGLDESEQIVFSPENPEYELLVFTDIDCGYCRKLHDQIDDYQQHGIAIRYMAFPRAGVGSHSFDKFVSVWCADDQQSALTLAKSGSEPEPMQCDNPVTAQYELGRQVGVSGTPALLTKDGTLIPGYMPPAQLRERLESIDAALAQAP